MPISWGFEMTLFCLTSFKAVTLPFPEKALTLSKPAMAWRQGRDLHSSDPSIRTIPDTSMYIVLVCWLRLTNIGHEMKPLKCIWHEKYFLLIWKAFQNTEEWCFFFEIAFFVSEILTFFYYANQISDDVILFETKNSKILNKGYLWKYWSSVLETIEAIAEFCPPN